MPEMGIGKFPNVKTDEIYFDRENLDILLKRLAANTLGLNTGDYFAADRFYVDAANLSHYIHRYSDTYGCFHGAWRVDGILAMALNRIINLGAPSGANDATRKAYVDDAIDTDIATHAADLDAHHYNEFEVVRRGDNIINPCLPSGTTTMVVVANYMYAIPFFTPVTGTFDRIVLEITGAGAGGTKARVGIYNNGTNLYPGTLVIEAGSEVSADSVAIHSVTIDQALTKGLYWLVITSNGTPTLRASDKYSKGTPLGYLAANLSLPCTYWYVARAYAALPDPFTAAGNPIALPTPLLLLRPKA